MKIWAYSCVMSHFSPPDVYILYYTLLIGTFDSISFCMEKNKKIIERKIEFFLKLINSMQMIIYRE